MPLTRAAPEAMHQRDAPRLAGQALGQLEVVPRLDEQRLDSVACFICLDEAHQVGRGAAGIPGPVLDRAATWTSP